jgi:arylsulfatase
MKRREFVRTLTTGATATCLPTLLHTGCRNASGPPNIVLFLADDLGYGELGCYGQKKIQTPNIDRLAAEGMRFTQCYSGSPVCAPSRCVLLTGLHSGHAHIRTNREVRPEGQLPIPSQTVTVAELLRAEGYATAAMGKWGLGSPGSPGDPNNQGFDLFYGYNCQRHAHNFYPRYLWRNDERVDLPGNDRGATGTHYSADLMEQQALQFVRDHQQQPFFLYYPTPVPHLALQVPDDSLQAYLGKWDDPPYDGSNAYLAHEHPRAAYAAMVTRMDRTVGRIRNLLEELGLAENTIFLFSSDNGATYLGGYDRDFFEGNGPLRSHKGYVYEGGIRVPLIANWPGHIGRGVVSEHICAFQDFLPTLMQVVGAQDRTPANIDGISFWPAIQQKGQQKAHAYLYMEFPSYGGQQMVRLGDWKAVRQNLMADPAAPVELYNLAEDLAEQNDVSAKHPGIVAQVLEIMKTAHTPSAEFPFPALDMPAADSGSTLRLV